MEFQTSVLIDREIEQVWAFLVDPFNIPRWAGASWLGIQPTSAGSLGRGSTLEGRIAILGFESRVKGTIIEWDPPRVAAISMAGLRGMRSGTLRLILEATANGTRATRVTELEPQPILKPLWAVLAPYFRRRGVAGDQKLKRLLEADRG